LDDESEELFEGHSPFLLQNGAETACSSVADINTCKFLPMGRYGSVPVELSKSYKLDSPLVLRKEGFLKLNNWKINFYRNCFTTN
jgi:hypothetical protein